MALVFNITVNPKSGRQAWILDKSGRIKCFLKSEPEKDRANQELIRTLSNTLDIPKEDIEILSGHTTRKKVIKIHKKMTMDRLLEALGLAQQKTIV